MDIISIIGTIFGAAGFVISIITWRNTANIKKGIEKRLIEKAYPDKHKEFTSLINVAINSLRDGGRKYYIIGDLIKLCRGIQAFYDNWDNKQRAKIDDFLIYLEKIPNQNVNSETQKEVLNRLYEISSQLERIGKLSGIR